MRRTTGLLTTGALGLSTVALLGTLAPGVASATDCGLTTLDAAGLETTFDSIYTGEFGAAAAAFGPDGVRLTTGRATATP